MTERMYTVGTKVRINCPGACGGEFHDKVGKVVKLLEGKKFPYLIEVNIKGHYPDIPFSRSELVRINKKRKNP